MYVSGQYNPMFSCDRRSYQVPRVILLYSRLDSRSANFNNAGKAIEIDGAELAEDWNHQTES